MSKRKTILVLEHFWDDEAKPINKEVSVLPYIDGICRLNNYELFYGRYANSKGFDEWIDRFKSILTHRERRVVLYIAGHGSDRTIGGKHVSTVLKHIYESANMLNIEGCILGCCHVGNNINDFKSWMTDCNLTWIVGYRHAVDWLPSTLCDISILNSMLSENDSILQSKSDLANILKDAVSIFNQNANIATDKNSTRQSFANTLACVIQPRRQGQRPIEVNLFQLL